MSHTHNHNHSPKDGLTLAFWLNLLFSIVEVIGGMAINSTAIIANAFHDFTDAIAIGLTVLLEKQSNKKRTPKFSYGFKRFSLLSALSMSIFLLIGAIFMSISAYKSFITPQIINSKGMLWLAVLGITINGLAFLKIKKSSEDSHQGEHSHEHQDEQSHSHSHNSKAVMLHLLEDVLGWAAVIVGAIVIHFTNWYWIDSLLTFAIAIFIGYNATSNLISTMKVLLQAVPENINIEELSNELQQINGVENIHDLHIWSLDGRYNIGSLHAVIKMEDQIQKDAIFSAIYKVMNEHKIQHPTIQIESNTNSCKLVNC
ncbi:cation diffusion facilitator family transporter [Flavobacterium sp. 5]|uniref:cation diffusion facilitator family transporter n=1 Tax=Flavobacterium sp. 5 TaxID=2035199 RepID=UPI000C2C7BAF|nr:cation diffusion facilitator family transporter [Flavobacterium sp. 5]PKB15304.1 cobalt-zinc-cadmium efflux system protein [Flavobacterium sp. 5]